MPTLKEVGQLFLLLLPGVAGLIAAAVTGHFPNLWVYIITPYITCAIGYGTNTVAVHMLFHPRYPKKICCMSFQGIFPKRQAKLAFEVGKTVNNKLLTHDDILAHMQKDEFQVSFQPVVARIIETLLAEGLNEVQPMWALMLDHSPKLRLNLKKDWVGQLVQQIPGFMDLISDKMRETVLIDKMVEHKIAVMDLADMERMFLDFMEEEFKFIEFLGGFLGFFVGVLQALVFFFT